MTKTSLLSKAAQVSEQLLDALRPASPRDFLKAQPGSFSPLLPYEAVLELERPTCLLGDGSLGLIWELTPLAHEVVELPEIMRRTGLLAEIFDKIRDDEVSFQVIFDSEPSPAFEVPAYLRRPKTAAGKILADRVQFVRSLADSPRDRLQLTSRRVFLTMRLACAQSLPSQLSAGGSELENAAAQLQTGDKRLSQLAGEVEYSLDQAGIGARLIDGQGILSLLRATLHSTSERRTSAMLKPEPPSSSRRLGSQIMRDFTDVTPAAIGVGDDSWEVCSWLDQPPQVFSGMWARLLEITVPHRLVVNIRPCQKVSDLDLKKMLLRSASDAFGELQRDEVRLTQDALARGESLSWVSVHLFVRNVGVTTREILAGGKAKALASQLKTLTQVPFIVERHAAPALFMLCLPLCFSAAGAGFSGRERRVLSRNLAPYLPVFGAFRGTKTPFQLMVSRGGSAAWLNPYDSETSPHVAVLASSGGGKSFFAQNLMTSFFAKHAGADKGPLLFIIDKKTSYEIFAEVIGEDVGSRVIKPPEQYPNIFRGKLDEFRLPVIVGLLKTAVSLVAPGARLGAVEETLLALAVRLTFTQNELDARTEYKDGVLSERTVDKVRLPCLRDIVDNLFPVAAESGVAEGVATALGQHLSPFLGQGPYAALFDRDELDDLDPETPGVSLYDLDAVASNPVLATLTTQMILAEIVRQIRRPENRGRPGMLVIEEAGVLAASSPEIVAFIQDAWKTFRKLGFACIGLTNEVDDFARKPGPREIWNVSPNKIILRMLDKDLQKALTGLPEAGLAPLIEDQHIGTLIGTLAKKDGAFSQGLWWSGEVRGTFVFHPTGFDYWCAASKPIEVEAVREVKRYLGGSYFQAVQALAEGFPAGVRTSSGSLLPLTAEELAELKRRAAL